MQQTDFGTWHPLLRQLGEPFGSTSFSEEIITRECRQGKLDGLTQSETTPGNNHPLAGLRPIFRHLDTSGLVYLRTQLLRNESISVETQTWLEMALRVTEVLGSKLRKRVIERFPNRDQAREFGLQLASLLMDSYLISYDLRFLNTAFKLAEMDWLTQPKSLKTSLTVGSYQRQNAVLALRLLILCDTTKRRLLS